MKNLKIKTASAALLLSLFAVSASAQPQQPHRAPNGKEHPTAEKMAEIATDKLDQVLELSDSQESKIYKINLSYAEKAEAARQEAKAEREAQKEEKAEGEKRERPDREAMMEKQKAAQESRKAQQLEIMEVLKDSQKIDYAMMLAKQPQRGGKPQQGMRGGEQGGKPQQGKQGGNPQQGKQGGNKANQKDGQQRPQGGRPERNADAE